MIEAIEALSLATQSVDGTSITYRRGSQWVKLTATVGRTSFANEAEVGQVQEQLETRDYIFSAAELILSGSVTLPKRGDLVEQKVGKQTHKYAVVSDDGIPPYRFCDRHNTLLRVHTTKVTSA